MIIGIGVDVVDTPRFQGSLVRTPGLNTRLFTEKELNSPGGKGENAVSLAARFAAEAKRQGITNWHLSLSHDGNIATAFVIAEKQ